MPIRCDGSKEPRGLWKQYQTEKYPWHILRKWIGGNGHGIGIICGQISGGLEVLDFDDPLVFPLWASKSDPCLLKKLVIVETPSRGRHLYYRCSEIEGNQQLALTENEAIRIETRGIGGYVVGVGSPLTIHPSGRPYSLIQGSLLAIPTITPNERAGLLSEARAFNEYKAGGNAVKGASKPLKGNVKRVKIALKPIQTTADAVGHRTRIGDLFNQSATWESIIEPLGWTIAGTSRGIVYWRKPNSFKRGHHATTGCGSGDYFRCFSTNCSPIKTDKAYDKFGLYTLLYHSGDFHKAVKSLTMKGVQ